MAFVSSDLALPVLFFFRFVDVVTRGVGVSRQTNNRKSA